MSGSKILIVEDDHDISAIYASVLTEGGHTVTVTYSGKQALEYVAALTPDIVLLDIMMPDMDGIEVLEKMRTDRLYATLRPIILVMTNLNRPDIKERVKQLGAKGYIVKANIAPRDMLDIVQEAVRRSNPST